MSANSSGSGRTGGGASPQETKPSTSDQSKHEEIPYIDDPEKHQVPPEQRFSSFKEPKQTMAEKLFHGKTSRDTNPNSGEPCFSQSFPSTESSSQAGKKYSVATHLNSSLNAGSSKRVFPGPKILPIQWNIGQEIKRNELFEISLYHGKRIRYVIEITCMPDDFYILNFMFCNTNTVEDLSKSFMELDCTLERGKNEVHLGSKICNEKSEYIRDAIEGVIVNVKATSNIRVHHVETSFAGEKLDEKSKEFSSEFRSGNIAIYESGKCVWIVGRNKEELKVLEKRLIEDNVLQKASYGSKDFRGLITDDKTKNKENLWVPSGQTTLPDSTKTMDTKSPHGDSNKEGSIKPRSSDMSEMTKETIAGKQQTFNNQFFQETVSTSQDRTTRKKRPETGGEQSKNKIMIRAQHGKKQLEEIDLPCNSYNYFKWMYCLSDPCCLASLKDTCLVEGVEMQMLKSKHPLFEFPASMNDVKCIQVLQEALKETVKQYDIIYHIFNWDLVRPEKDLDILCNNWNKTTKDSHVSLILERSYGGIALCLVGERPDVESLKPYIESELNRDIQIEETVEPCTLNKKFDDACIKILEKMKEKLEKDFHVAINFESNSEVRFTATSKEAISGVIREVKEIAKSVHSLKLPFEYLVFLNRSESARLYLEQQLRKQKLLRLHFLGSDENNTIQVFEENSTKSEEVNKKIQGWLFCIPSTDELCQIFSFDEGKKVFSRLVEENEGKVQMVLDESKQPCCVGTIDIKEKIESTLSGFRLKNEQVKLPSEEVWQFCARHRMLQDIAKEAGCEVHFAESKANQWCVEVRGPVALISECCNKIENEIRKIKSETVLPIDYNIFDESTVTNLIQKWNAEKRCFVNTQWVKAKPSAPWKKWIIKNGIEITMIYFVNLNSLPEIHENELKLVLIPEEQTGAKSKNLCVPIPGQSIVQISVPSFKTRDFVERGFKEVLKMNKEQWKKETLIVDCERVPEKELKISMKTICFTLDNTARSDSNITMCEFCDTRLEIFHLMTKIINEHLSNKHYLVLQWKGRSIDIDVKTGQLAQQKGFDVLVNSTSWNLDLTAGLTSKSILKAAGPGIQKECKERYKRGIHIGDIAITEGHGLNCKFVFHGSLVSYDSKENFQSLRKMIRKCLETADKMKMESIAFPALGTGSLGYARRDVANVLFEEVEKYENEVRLGTLSRLCCVIYQEDIDAVEQFQKRHLKWAEDHKLQNTSKEVVVTSDNPDVIKEICQVVKLIKHYTATNLEPPVAEITKNMRLGNFPAEDAKNDHTKNRIQQSNPKVGFSSEEKRCLLITCEENSEKGYLDVWERSLRKDFKDRAENIVFPFNSPNLALLQFSSEKDLEDISKADNFIKNYNIQKFPPQAVVCIEAVVSPRMADLLKKKRITDEEIRSKSGAFLHKKDTATLVLSGNILEIKAAHKFFANLMKEDSHDLTSNVNQKKQPVSKAAENLIQAEHLKDDASNGKSISGDDSKKYSFKQPPVTGNNEFGEQRQIPSTVKKLDKPKFLKNIKCTDEEATILKYFNKNLMENVEVVRIPDNSIVELRFRDQDTGRKIEENLDKIKNMPHEVCPVPNVASISKIIATKCSDDTYCFISRDCQQIEIVGIKRDNVCKIKEDLNMLLKPEIPMTENPDESSKMPVLVTNEGVSVFAECASLLDLQTSVDAIICPISKLSDLEYGLPKSIVEATKSEHVQELRNIFKSNGNIFPDLSVFPFQTKYIKSCKHVVYVSTHRSEMKAPDYEPEACEQFLLELMLQVFLMAEKYGFHTIAIPAICSGKNGFTKEVCAKCYGTSVLKYSRTIQYDAQGLSDIHFVDISAEMISYIESVFTQPDLVDTFEEKAKDSGQSSSNPSWHPFSSEDGTFYLSENICLTIIDSNELKEYQKDRTLVYQAIISTMDKWRVITDLIQDEVKKQFNKSKNVAFCTNGSLSSNLKHIELPVLGNRMDIETFGQMLASFYCIIFQEAEKQQITKIIMPLYGLSKGQDRVTALCARCLFQELKNVHMRLSPTVTCLDVVVAVEDRSTNDIVIKEIETLIESEISELWQIAGNPNKRSRKRTRQMQKQQKQPNGRISFKTTKTCLKDFKCGTIEIHVAIPNGVQQTFHPKPGEQFIGRKETLYLPDNHLGHSIASMIEKAFKQRILYDVKTNTTQGIEMVIGNDTSLISKRENFPDPKQLQHLHSILKKKIES